MRTLTIMCGCGKVIKKINFDDDKPNSTIMGMCQRCVNNGRQFIRDEEEERKEREFIAFGKSVKNTKPLRKKKR